MPDLILKRLGKSNIFSDQMFDKFSYSNFLKIDFISRIFRFLGIRRLSNINLLGVLCVLVSLQTVAEFFPFAAWFTWPYLIFFCTCVAKDATGSVSKETKYFQKTLSLSARKGDVLISLALYGALGLIIFRGLMEFLLWTQFSTVLLPQSVLSLLPFTVSHALSTLFIAACASRLCLDERDPLKILGFAFKDLFFSPLSTVVIVLVQSVFWTSAVLSFSMSLNFPYLATLLGHAPLVFFIFIWICGQLFEENTS
jgi:hypothetical protein